jgi:hypothetical protein
LFVVIVAVTAFKGCGGEAYINVYDKSITEKTLPCLAIDPMSGDKLKEYISPLYRFDKSCEYRIVLSSKSGISCNSSFNSSQKSSSNFPNAYLRVELKRGMRLLFSYYKDLTSAPKKDDVEDAFEALKRYIKLK